MTRWLRAMLWVPFVIGCAAEPAGTPSPEDAGTVADAGTAPECAGFCGPAITEPVNTLRFTYGGQAFDPALTEARFTPLGTCGGGWLDFPGIQFHMGFNVPDVPACGRATDLANAQVGDFVIGFIHAVPGRGPVTFGHRSGILTLRSARVVEDGGSMTHLDLAFDCTSCVFESDATPGDTLAVDGRLDFTF